MTDPSASTAPSPAVRPITEEPRPGRVPAVHRADWARSYPWLIQGVTTRGPAPHFDMRLRGPAPGDDVLARWDLLAREAGGGGVVHARQVHGAGIRAHRAGLPGLRLVPPSDGHLTGDPGILLTVSLADCVPVFLVEPRTRALALLHAGWRGVAAGIVEAGVGAMRDRFGVEPGALEAHIGPAIAREGYEVGPEVHRALGLPDPGRPAPVDLRAAILERLRALEVFAEKIGVSSLDTLGDERFFSHRGGDGGRQVAFLGSVVPGETRP